MKDPARVTVVIPAYKAEATIRRAVDSVLAQEGVERETIVVVDGLLDDTLERLRGYDPERVQVIVHPQNRGAQVSRNAGLAAATGEFVMFLDCDDFIEGPLLRGLASKAQQEEADIAFGPMQRLKEPSGARRQTVFRSFETADDLFRRWMAEGEVVPPCAILWRTAFLCAIGGWNERIRRNQDGEVVMRTILSGGRFTTSREGRGIYVDHQSADRVTRRPENLVSPIEVGETLLAIDSSAVSETVKRHGLASYFYRIALRLYAFGRADLARQALRRARELGLRGGYRIEAHRLFAKLIGIPFQLQLFQMHQSALLVRLLLGLAALNVNSASSAGRLRIR